MEAMKIQEEANKEGSSTSNSHENMSQGDGKGIWHRTNRNTAQIQAHMDSPNNTNQPSVVKRLRMDDSWIKSTDNTMVGPAERASQSS
ncbi:hypothetical protein TSUD_293220 [Trifolium subterraneum]|uniref:Uncharacterized protein n=1 Tax=Trifolium subterraneum TaxID=3900 RepID=A0A2Z6MYR7_TRISU|nr:hypothetical protein TSUD_293220 [Trifolium subterraneum]